MSIHKKELITSVVEKLKSYGYTVYVSKTGEYGFYTDGKQVVCFGGCRNFSVDYSGNYRSRHCGSGWQIEKDMGVATAEQAEQYINALPPMWATRGEAVTLTTPEQYLKTYGASSGYVKV